MAIALVATLGNAGGANGATTTPAVDTTGATLLFAGIGTGSQSGGFGAPSMGDNKSNSFTALTTQDSGATNEEKSWYVAAPTVGSGHTATVSGSSIFAGIIAAAFSGVITTSPLDGQSGTTTASASSLAPGSLTPSVSGCVAITTLGINSSAGVTTPSGYTLIDGIAKVPGTNQGCYMAYKILPGTSAENPSWVFGGTADAAVTLAIFKPAAAGASSWGAQLSDQHNRLAVSL